MVMGGASRLYGRLGLSIFVTEDVNNEKYDEKRSEDRFDAR